MFDFNHKMRYSVFNKYLYSKSDARSLLPKKAARSNHGEHFAHISQLELKFHKRVIAELLLIISYCKKAGYHMEKSDILTASLPDANYETTDHSTIFDDVFRTIAQKMPQLLIPLINEVFHTSYSEEEHFEQ